ncbi:hypothetical protein [Streptacidiphilus anmyonensis]|uniref:hypothetical protein n=1 Tax=Streptacidiphilus anmyonensis TaxID=405782 RepID=UPI0005A743C7|nr:hypothetical protein [Streptacidiphilus anmyonensis]
MPPDIALVESRALRGSVVHRVEALDKVKILTLLPDGTYVTTRMVAEYFEVAESTINNLSQRHREELEANGFRVLKGVEKSRFVKLNMSFTQVSGGGIAIYDRRAVLNVAMLLRDSDVARRVRAHLLDAEERVVHSPADRPQPRPYGMPPGRRLGPGPHWDEYEVTSRDPDAEAWRQVIDREVPPPAPSSGLGEVIPDGWAESFDRRLDSFGRVCTALNDKVDGLAEEVRDVRQDVRSLRSEIRRSPRRSRPCSS